MISGMMIEMNAIAGVWCSMREVTSWTSWITLDRRQFPRQEDERHEVAVPDLQEPGRWRTPRAPAFCRGGGRCARRCRSGLPHRPPPAREHVGRQRRDEACGKIANGRLERGVSQHTEIGLLIRSRSGNSVIVLVATVQAIYAVQLSRARTPSANDHRCDGADEQPNVSERIHAQRACRRRPPSGSARRWLGWTRNDTDQLGRTATNPTGRVETPPAG